MQKNELGVDGVPITSLVVPSRATSNSVSATDHEILPMDIPKPNQTFSPGTFVAQVTSAASITTPGGAANIPIKSAAKRGKNKNKTSPSVDETTFVALNMKDNQDDEEATDEDVTHVLVPPGAVSVPGINSSIGSPNEISNTLLYIDPGRADRDLSVVVAAQLVTQDEDLENRIEQEVESRLMKRDPMLVVAEAVPPPNNSSIETTCKMHCWRWKYVILFILLWVCGTIAGVIISGRSNSAQLTPGSTRDKETQTKIMEVLQGNPYLTIDDDPTTNTAQSRALQWLVFYDSNSLTQNGKVSDTIILERYALALLFYSTNGLSWQERFDFVTSTPVCDWNDESVSSPDNQAHGVNCDADLKVRHIWLRGNNLNGTIPSELGLVSKLQILNLAENLLNGTLATETGHLTALRDLQINNNFLNGSLPSELGLLTSLIKFDASRNYFTGSLPTEFGRLTMLEIIHLNETFIMGNLFPVVKDFYNDDGLVFNNSISSPQYQALVWLASDAQSESLDGDRIRTLYALAVFYYTTNGDDFISLPTWREDFGFLNSTTDNICKWNNGDKTNARGLWCDSTETKVEVLSFSSNNLVGVIPEEIGMLKDIQYLLVADNRLGSTLPESLFALSNLRGVDLYGNSFSGSLPSTLAEATSLEVLHLGNNALKGLFFIDHIVNSVFCPLTFLVLTGNTFSGTFPLESIAANCTNMTDININDCGVVIDGSFPSFGLEQVRVLDLSKTKLGGSIPDGISRLRHLQQFKADYNTLTGTLPASLGELMNLTDLSLARNTINGTIPSTLGQLEQLMSLDLQSNLLEGIIPLELANCTNLVDVNIQMNTLSGNIDFLCPLNLQRFSSDCDTRDVTCTCCTDCY